MKGPSQKTRVLRALQAVGPAVGIAGNDPRVAELLTEWEQAA